MTILFRNSQWAVTNIGLHSLTPAAPYKYDIEAERLLERTDAGTTIYKWPLHMAEKNWIDFAAFEEAFRKALEEHVGKYKEHVEPDVLETSFSAGWERIRRG